MTSTQPVDLSGRFRLAPDEAVTDWLTEIVLATEAGEGDLYISSSWDPRQVNEEANIDLLVQTAAGDDIIICPDGMTVGFVYDGTSYWFEVSIGRGINDRVDVATWGYEMRKLDDGESTGVEAAAGILAEAVYLANGVLDRLQRMTAVPADIRAAIAKVVGYNWGTEETDYTRNCSDEPGGNQRAGHVFESLQLLSGWLAGRPATQAVVAEPASLLAYESLACGCEWGCTEACSSGPHVPGD